MLRSGDYGRAAALCRKSIALNRDARIALRMLADCHYNLGVVALDASGTSEAARADFQRAFELDPTHADAASNLGASLVLGGDFDQAVKWFRAAAAAAPREVRYRLNLARTLVLTQELDEASAVLNSLAMHDPGNAGAYRLAEALLVPEITPDVHAPARMRAAILDKLERISGETLAIRDPLAISASYFPLSYHGISNVEINRRLASAYLRHCPSLAWIAPHVPGWTAPRSRIRIGLASRFFRNHSISNTSRGFFERFDRERFEVIAIRLEPSPGDESARAIDAAADRVVTLPGSSRLGRGDLESARAAIAQLQLDVLFYQDIGLEPLAYFLAFSRLAPVQLTSFGHPDTTGIPVMDYFVSAERYEPSGAQDHYSEKLVLLPDVGTLAYYHRPAVPPPAARDELAVEDGDRIYFCPQTLQKVQPAMDDIFLRIAELDPHARIVLIAFEPRKRDALQERLARRSSLLAQRVRFVERVQYDRFLARLAAADVVLDTAHFNGQNTTLEAFACATPVVTMPGNLQRGRHGYGLYSAMGFMDLVADDPEDYAKKAVRVAGDPAFREYCRERIAQGCPRVFEDERLIAGMQDALEQMVKAAAA